MPNSSSTAGKARLPRDLPAKKPSKKATNLTLDADALRRGERFSKRHGTSVSKLVTDFLRSLPDEPESDVTLAELVPVVRRMYGVAAQRTVHRSVGRAGYRAHLVDKYGAE